jgi:2-polyprenyl-6-methoxyphenol hydroxylase-like FAD-dependent oxidoreductase
MDIDPASAAAREASIVNECDTSDTDVLIVGAGPTGLVLALWLQRLGIRVRVIDKAAAPGTTSRALAVHARTLELYRQLGLAEKIVGRGLELSAVNLWVRGERVGHVAFGDIGRGVSAFPYILIFQQDQHEALLIDELRALGVEVERPTELVDVEEQGDHVRARLRRDGEDSTCRAAFLAGCDGAHSRVREGLAVGFPGGTYEHLFYVADVALSGPVADQQLHVALDDADFIAIFPLAAPGTARLIGTITEAAAGQARDQIGWDDVSPTALQHLQMKIERVNWFSTYRVHHRVAERFRRGRVFLVGDAAHIHSPVGGQGMNTGIGDAVNLAWKLAAVLRDRASPALLDSYEPERIRFAERLVATTDRAFTFATRPGALARRVRINLVPALVPPLMLRTAVRRFVYRTISQTAIQYRHSELSEGSAGPVHGGDRLPWIPPTADSPAAPDNFAPLRTLDWQLHVYGQPPPALVDAARRRGLPLHTFPWQPQMATAKLVRDAAYLVRPDGYLALVDPHASAPTLERYLDARALQPGGA